MEELKATVATLVVRLNSCEHRIAGYAGGIVSAAVDGMKCAEAVISSENGVKLNG